MKIGYLGHDAHSHNHAGVLSSFDFVELVHLVL